jgi:hypothetical protein
MPQLRHNQSRTWAMTDDWIILEEKLGMQRMHCCCLENLNGSRRVDIRRRETGSWQWLARAKHWT